MYGKDHALNRECVPPWYTGAADAAEDNRPIPMKSAFSCAGNLPYVLRPLFGAKPLYLEEEITADAKTRELEVRTRNINFTHVFVSQSVSHYRASSNDPDATEYAIQVCRQDPPPVRMLRCTLHSARGALTPPARRPTWRARSCRRPRSPRRAAGRGAVASQGWSRTLRAGRSWATSGRCAARPAPLPPGLRARGAERAGGGQGEADIIRAIRAASGPEPP